MKFGKHIFHSAKCGVAIALGFAVTSGVAHATLLYTIWNGAGLNTSATFPVPTTGLLLPTFSDNGPINFANHNAEGGSNTFADFFGASSAGTHLSAAQLATTMSTQGDGDTTFIRITETYNIASSFSGTIDHDDGAAIYLDGAGNGAQLCGNPAEATENTEPCLFPAGNHTVTLLYTEDNGAPAILIASIPPEAAPVPEPMTLGLLGGGLTLLGIARWRRSVEKVTRSNSLG